MFEFIKTETGWKLCWGGAALYREVRLLAPQVRAGEAPAPRLEEREPAKTLSA